MKLADYFDKDRNSLYVNEELKSEEINAIIEEIKNYPNLERIHFENNKLNSEKMYNLRIAITQMDNTNLKSLAFNNCMIENEALKYFLPCLPELKSIKELSFERNCLNDEVVLLFGNFLQDSSVEVLSLSSNPITGGIEEFIQFIPGSKIKKLDLCVCSLSNNNTIKALCKIIPNSQLTHITIGGCDGSNDDSELDSEFVAEMNNLLKQNRKKK